MTRSIMPTYFHESAEQSSCPELSDELNMALAEGRWWAIMEVSDPISAYEDPSSWQWRGTVEEGETSSPTSLVFSDKSVNAQSPHSGFSDTTLKTKKQWRQKETRGAPVSDGPTQGTPAQTRFLKGAPVLVRSAMGKPINDASEKAMHSSFPDASLKTRDQQRIQRQKKPQGAPVPAESSREPPVPAGSQQRGKLMIPGHLIKHLQKAALELGELLPAGSPQRVMGKPTSSQLFSETSVNAQSPHSGFSDTLKTKKQWRQKETRGAPVSDGHTKGTPVPTRFLKGASVLVGSATGKPINDASEKAMHSSFPDASLKTRDQQRIKRQKRPQGAPVPAESSREPPVPAGSQQRGKLMIPEHLIKHLQKAALELGELLPAGSPPKAPMPSVSSQKILMRTKSPQRAHVPSTKVFACSPHGATMPDKVPDRQKQKISEPLRREPLQQKPYGYSLQGAPVTNKNPEKKELKIPDPMRQEMLQQNPQASSIQVASMTTKSPLDVPLPSSTPIGVSVNVRTPQEAAVQNLQNAPVPVSFTQEESMASRIPKSVSEHSGIPHHLRQQKPQAVILHSPSAHSKSRPISSLQRAPTSSRRKRLCPWSTEVSHDIGDSATFTPKRFKPEPESSEQTSTHLPADQEESIGQCMEKLKISDPVRQQKPQAVILQSPSAHSQPRPISSLQRAPTSSRRKRLCPWITEVSHDLGDSTTFTPKRFKPEPERSEQPSTQLPADQEESIGQCMKKVKITDLVRRQKPQAVILYSPSAYSQPRPISSLQRAPMFSRRKRLCPWSTEVSHDVGDSATFTPKRFKPEPDSSEQISTQLPADWEESIAGQCRQKIKITDPVRQQKPHAVILHSPSAHSHPRLISSLQRAPMSIRRKRLCPWSTDVSYDVGDLATFISKRFKPEPGRSEKTSTQRRALDNAVLDQSSEQKSAHGIQSQGPTAALLRTNG